MNYKLEVKVEGLARNKNVEYDVLWLNWSEFQLIPTVETRRLASSIGIERQAGVPNSTAKARERYLIEHGYDPNAVYEDAA